MSFNLDVAFEVLTAFLPPSIPMKRSIFPSPTIPSLELSGKDKGLMQRSRRKLSKRGNTFTASLQVTSLEVAELDRLGANVYMTILVDGKEQKRVTLGKRSNDALEMPQAIDVTLRPSSTIEIRLKRQSGMKMDWLDRDICRIKRGVVELAIKNKGAAGNVRVKLDVDPVFSSGDRLSGNGLESASTCSVDDVTLVADEAVTPHKRNSMGDDVADDRTLGILRFEAGLRLQSAYHRELLEAAYLIPKLSPKPDHARTYHHQRKESTQRVERWLQQPDNVASHDPPNDVGEADLVALDTTS